MILVDANLLIYAFVQESVDHEKARDWHDFQSFNGLTRFREISTNDNLDT